MSQALAVVGGRTFASVRKHRNYRLYFAGQAVSFTRLSPSALSRSRSCCR